MGNIVYQSELYARYVDLFSDTAELYNEKGFCKRVKNCIDSATRYRSVSDIRHMNTNGKKVAALKNVCLVDDSNQETRFDKSRNSSSRTKRTSLNAVFNQDPFAIHEDHITYPVAKEWENLVKEILT